MEITKQEYLERILRQIFAGKDRGTNSLYLMNETATTSTIRYLEAYFKPMSDYTLETKKCARCKNQWDIIITWR